ncbi:MAG: hypothetical protein CNC06_00755 [Pelagibacterales bacterium MED-G40]|nr:MAG: hypothetical protein CNC06_00755 [Pelagibacterales bacterium MED-G40]|tara:strand:- start:47 stop:544 length:498 start_codon:yes stop_codon:yes gene_type:complete
MKFRLFLIQLFFVISVEAIAETPKSVGKYKNWQSFTTNTDKGKICFAQSVPSKRGPESFKREDSRLFVTFRPGENITDEVSITSGHLYKPSSVVAKSGKSSFSFFSQEKFAWLLDEREEKKFIKVMKRATNLMIKANAKNGTQTTDHYSMMGFTKAYNTAKKVCG